MISHHVKETQNRDNENFSIRSSFVYIIAIIAVIVASIVIIVAVIKGLYTTQFRTFFITVPVMEIPIDKTYHLWSEPVKNIIIDRKQDKDSDYSLLTLQNKPFKKIIPQIKTVTDFNKEFYNQLVLWERKNHILKKEKLVFRCQGDVSFASDMFFEENSDILTSKGEVFLYNIVRIFKNLTIQLHQDVKWDIQVGGVLPPLSLRAKISILRDMTFMRYVQHAMGTQRTVAFYISFQKAQNFSQKTLCENNISLKMVPAKNF